MAENGGSSVETILLVEDDVGAIRLLEEAIDETEYNLALISATDGVEAFDVLHRRGEYRDGPTPQIIVLDLGLPDKQGQQILSEIREDDQLRNLPIVIFSESTDQDTIDECYRLGANAFVSKPKDYDDLLTFVNKLVCFWLKTASLPSTPKSAPS